VKLTGDGESTAWGTAARWSAPATTAERVLRWRSRRGKSVSSCARTRRS
jgi:hypothetical protein